MSRRVIEDQLRQLLQRIWQGRPERRDSQHVADRRALGRWQSRRLLDTHADLHGSDRYRPAVEFFFSDLYVDRDLTGRDRDLERLTPLIVRTMPKKALTTLVLALEMEALTQDLDISLLNQLADGTNSLDDDTWVEAYRRCNNYDDRQRQVDLIGIIGKELDQVVHAPGVKLALKLSRQPARLAGLSDMQSILERGCSAFRHMRRADSMLQRITHRETTIIKRIRDGHPRPLRTSDLA